MDDQQLKWLLHSVGYRAFVEFYSVFADSSLTTQQAVDLLPADEPLGGRRVRVSCARRIIGDGFARQALDIVAASKRVDHSTADGARELLAALTS